MDFFGMATDIVRQQAAEMEAATAMAERSFAETLAPSEVDRRCEEGFDTDDEMLDAVVSHLKGWRVVGTLGEGEDTASAPLELPKHDPFCEECGGTGWVYDAADAAHGGFTKMPCDCVDSTPLPGSTEYEQGMMEWDLLRVESEVNGALQHKAPQNRDDHPDPNWVKGRCPACGSPLVANLYYRGGTGYRTLIECWQSLGSFREPSCWYRRTLG